MLDQIAWVEIIWITIINMGIGVGVAMLWISYQNRKEAKLHARAMQELVKFRKDYTKAKEKIREVNNANGWLDAPVDDWQREEK